MAAPIGAHLLVRAGKRSEYDRSRATRPEIRPRVDLVRNAYFQSDPRTPYTLARCSSTDERLSSSYLDYAAECLVLEICGELPEVFFPHFTCVVSVADIDTSDDGEMRPNPRLRAVVLACLFEKLVRGDYSHDDLGELIMSGAFQTDAFPANLYCISTRF